jgi:hypothetical protein
VVSQATDEQVSVDVPDAEGELSPAINQQSGSAAPALQTVANLTPIRGQNLQPIFE